MRSISFRKTTTNETNSGKPPDSQWVGFTPIYQEINTSSTIDKIIKSTFGRMTSETQTGLSYVNMLFSLSDTLSSISRISIKKNQVPFGSYKAWLR